MRALVATVVHNEPLVAGLSRLSLAAPPLAAALPGQALAVRQPAALSVMAHPFPLAAIEGRAGLVDIVYPATHTLAPWLSTLASGSSLALLAPWGRPFPVDPQARHAVLLAGDLSLFALLALARRLVDGGVAVVALYEAETAARLAPPALLPPAVEVHIATADGSAGTRGGALDLLPSFLPWADTLYAALPPAAYPLLRDLVYRHRLRVRRGFATALAGAPLACYTAACDGCAVPLRHDRYALLCKDGPAFDLLDLP